MQKENELFSKLNGIKREINTLRGKLNEVDREKESWFQKKEECGKKIKSLISQIKEKRNKRDSFTKKVKEDKEERNSINKKVKNNISELKKLNEEKRSLLKKHNIMTDPSKIRTNIDKLEVKLETEAIPFEKEKAIVKKIKDLKKKFNESKVLGEVLEKNNNLYKETYNLKKEGEIFHSIIQKNARESQSIHEELITNSKEIDELKINEEEAFSKFFEFKKKFGEINNALKDKLKDFSVVNFEVVKIKHEKEERIIKNKEELIQEKIKKGKKLTNEDFLVFQNQRK